MKVLYPLEVNKEARTYIEAAILAHNQHNYAFAIENFEIA